MRKFGYMVIGGVFTLIISMGLITFADTSSSVELELSNDNDKDLAEVVEVQQVNESPVILTGPLEEEEETTQLSDEQDREHISEPKSFLKELEKLEVKLESDQTKIEIKQERKKNNIKSEVEIELKNEKMKLKDQRAEEFLEELFATIEIESNKDLEKIADQLLNEFQMNPHAVEIELKVKNLDGRKYKLEIEN
ncbi:YusW family protein [Halalkalibacter krulwichiae]|uniref:YusW-like protein n=1 Tax=Halalkalibacter krulwichiae TaxID=199441 RepID=A0A1X9M869_9BACI|nr:YusW family protein [Halalkalibacter krulwichiae]ARK29597.1 hypothetical protein BkAM31D_06830 [Halalkalibacter krulwichiae]